MSNKIQYRFETMTLADFHNVARAGRLGTRDATMVGAVAELASDVAAGVPERPASPRAQGLTAGLAPARG